MGESALYWVEIILKAAVFSFEKSRVHSQLAASVTGILGGLQASAAYIATSSSLHIALESLSTESLPSCPQAYRLTMWESGSIEDRDRTGKTRYLKSYVINDLGGDKPWYQ